jgi:hypothetical protein
MLPKLSQLRRVGNKAGSPGMLITPHHAYSRYILPQFIIHASDIAVTIRSQLGDMRICRLAEKLTTGTVLYSCVPWDTLLLYGDESLWTIRTWNGKISSMTYGDVKIYPLEMAFDEGIFQFFNYLDSRDIAAASLNTMSTNLWRSTLNESVEFSEQPNAKEYLGLSTVLIGGRKEAKPGTYRRRVEYDITAAYPNALATGMPNRIVAWDRSTFGPIQPDKWEGIAKARVRIPPLRWGPIPVIVDPTSSLTCYGYTRPDRWANVTLPLSELRMAESMGVDVIYDRISIALPSERNAFAAWMADVVPEMRAISNAGGKLGKLVANRLWSTFAISPNGVRREHRFSEGKMVSVDLPGDSDKLAVRRSSVAYVGGITQSRVRQRVYREGLAHFPDCVYVDTDGVIAKRTDRLPDGWRVKVNMRTLEIAAAQAIRYTCDDCLPAMPARISGSMVGPSSGHTGPHWTVAGASDVAEKSRLFAALKGGGMIVANINNVLPAQDMGNFGNVDSIPMASEAITFLTNA